MVDGVTRRRATRSDMWIGPPASDVEHLGLGHGDADVPEVRGVLQDEELHHALVGEHDLLDQGRVTLVGRLPGSDVWSWLICVA